MGLRAPDRWMVATEMPVLSYGFAPVPDSMVFSSPDVFDQSLTVWWREQHRSPRLLIAYLNVCFCLRRHIGWAVRGSRSKSAVYKSMPHSYSR